MVSKHIKSKPIVHGAMDLAYGLSSYQFRPNNGPCPASWFKINFNTIVRPDKVYFAAMLK